MSKFNLFYHCENNGDGSASVRFHQTDEEAEEADENQSEPFGESSVSSISLKFENGKLLFETRDDHYKKIWKEASATE